MSLTAFNDMFRETVNSAPSLFDLQAIPHRLTAEERFQVFVKENPQVQVELTKLALELVEAGHERLSISMIYETLRYFTALRTTDVDFKLNNDYRSRYARLLMEDPRLAGRFETRELHEPSVAK